MSIFLFSTLAYGQIPSDLSYRFLPNKIVEKTDAILQVYSKGDTAPTSINNLVATSSDSSIVQILGIEQNPDDFISYVKIHAASAGTANIALAAPGFSSQEIPVTIYKDNMASKLLIKTTPNIFSTVEAEKGYVSVELANDVGVPIKAREDIVITLSTSDSNIVQLKNTGITIKEGEYYAISQFEIKNDGTAQIFASSSSMSTVSSTVTVNTAVRQQTIQSYVFPSTINSFQNSNGYVVVQLHDSDGNPVLANEDIPVSVKVVNASKIAIVNTSSENTLISANGPLVIKKGSYWAYTPLSVRAGLNNTYEVDISAKGYLVSQAASQIKVTSVSLFADNSAKIDTLPILATGQKELVGILHLEDNDKPVISSNNLQINVDSSDPKSLSIGNVILNKGSGAIPVFGQTGTTIPTPVTLTVLTQNTQTVTPTIVVPTKESFALAADPLIPAILSNNQFPLAIYMTKNDQITYFPTDMNSFVTSKDSFQTQSVMLHKGDSIVVQDSTILKDGPATLAVGAGDFSTNISIQSLSTKPASLVIDYADKLFSNLKNTFSIQLLDSEQNPVFLEHDTQFKLVSNNPSVLDVPDTVTIKKGNYYSLFGVQVKNAGKTELAALTSEIPLAKFDIDVTELTPEVTIDSTEHVNPNFAFDAILNTKYKSSPLGNLKVDWNVQGAKIQNMDSVTDKEGKAKISLISDDPNTVTIQASVSGGIFGSTTASKTIAVNPPLISTKSPDQSQNINSFSILGINPLFVIIPGAAAASGIILKKKNMFDGITEKLSLGEKFSSIRERISVSSNK